MISANTSITWFQGGPICLGEKSSIGASSCSKALQRGCQGHRATFQSPSLPHSGEQILRFITYKPYHLRPFNLCSTVLSECWSRDSRGHFGSQCGFWRETSARGFAHVQQDVLLLFAYHQGSTGQHGPFGRLFGQECQACGL